jgi:hypothetical protein
MPLMNKELDRHCLMPIKLLAKKNIKAEAKERQLTFLPFCAVGPYSRPQTGRAWFSTILPAAGNNRQDP